MRVTARGHAAAPGRADEPRRGRRLGRTVHTPRAAWWARGDCVDWPDGSAGVGTVPRGRGARAVAAGPGPASGAHREAEGRGRCVSLPRAKDWRACRVSRARRRRGQPSPRPAPGRSSRSWTPRRSPPWTGDVEPSAAPTAGPTTAPTTADAGSAAPISAEPGAVIEAAAAADAEHPGRPEVGVPADDVPAPAAPEPAAPATQPRRRRRDLDAGLSPPKAAHLRPKRGRPTATEHRPPRPAPRRGAAPRRRRPPRRRDGPRRRGRSTGRCCRPWRPALLRSRTRCSAPTSTRDRYGPDAPAVRGVGRALLADGERRPMRHERDGMWVTVLPGPDVPDYRLAVTYEGGGRDGGRRPVPATCRPWARSTCT